MSRRTQIGIRCAGLTLATVFGFFMAMACGGGGGTAATDDTPPAATTTIALTGTVAGPTVSGNLSVKRAAPAKAIWKKFGASKNVQKAISGTTLLPGLTVTCYTLGGTSLGSSTTDANGAFSINADTANLSGSIPIACSAKSDDDKTDLKLFATIDVEDGVTTDVAIGSITVESTLAAITMFADDLNCDPTNGEACTVPSGLDVQCLSTGLGQGIWSQVSNTNDSTFSSGLGSLQDFVKALYTVGITWDNLTCKTAATCIGQAMNCTISDADLAALILAASAVDDTLKQPFSTIKPGFTQACTVAKMAHDVLATNLAGSSDTVATCANMVAGGDDFAKVFLQPLLALPTNDDAIAQATSLFSPAAFKVFAAVIGNASAPADLDGFGPFMLGYVANAQEADSTLANISGSSAAIKYLLATGKAAAKLSSVDQKKNYAAGCFNALAESGDDLIEDCDDACIGFVTAPFAQDNFNSDTYDYTESSTWFSQIPGLPNSDKANLLTCASIVDMSSRFDCFMVLLEGGGGDDGDDDTPPPPVDENDDSDDIESIFSGPCNGTSHISYAQAQSALLTCNNGNALRNMYIAAHNSYSESGCMTMATINSIAGSYGVDLECGGGDDDDDSPSGTTYWDGTWYSDDTSCFPDISVTSGQNTLPVIRFDAPDNQSGSGTCHVYNASSSQAMSCSYTGAGLTTTAGPDTVITISGWPNTWCNATLTKTDPPEEDPAPASPDSGYFGTTTWYAAATCTTSSWNYLTNPATINANGSGISMYYNLTFDAPVDLSGAGTCSIHNGLGIYTTSCTYTGAGVGATAGDDTVITATGFPLWNDGATTDCTVTLTKTIPASPPEEDPDHYFTGTWYTSIPTCGDSTWNYLSTPETFVVNASGVATSMELGYEYSLTFHAQDNLSSDPPVDYTGSGFCKINNGQTGETYPATCTYENAGTGTAVDGTAIIKTTTFPLRTGAGYTDCSVILTRESPMINYWDGYWSETVGGITSCTLLTPFTITNGSATFGGNTVSIALPATYSDHGDCDSTVTYNSIEGVPGCTYQDVEVNSVTMRQSVNNGARLIITVWNDGIHEAGCTMDVTKGPAP